MKTVVLASGIDETKPLLFTTARITRLMHDHWPELEHLLINRLVAAEEGPLAEEDEMWMRVSTGEEEDESNKVKRKGLSDFELLEPDASYSEISLILVHVSSFLTLSFSKLILIYISSPQLLVHKFTKACYYESIDCSRSLWIGFNNS